METRIHQFSSLTSQIKGQAGPYLEFLRQSSLSMGIFELAAGGQDVQEPHTEDEVYFVVEGRAQFKLEERDFEVEPGSIIFVKAREVHRFHSVTQDLSVLVFFAPAERSSSS